MALTSTCSPVRSFLPPLAASAAGGDDSRRRFLAGPRAIARPAAAAAGWGEVSWELGGEGGGVGLVAPRYEESRRSQRRQRG